MTPKNYFIHWIKRCIIEITNGLAEQQRPEAQARKEQENNDLGKRRSRPPFVVHPQGVATVFQVKLFWGSTGYFFSTLNS